MSLLKKRAKIQKKSDMCKFSPDKFTIFYRHPLDFGIYLPLKRKKTAFSRNSLFLGIVYVVKKQ